MPSSIRSLIIAGRWVFPALAINWGVLGGEGYVARNERVAEFLARQGTPPSRRAK